MSQSSYSMFFLQVVPSLLLIFGVIVFIIYNNIKEIKKNKNELSNLESYRMAKIRERELRNFRKKYYNQEMNQKEYNFETKNTNVSNVIYVDFINKRKAS